LKERARRLRTQMSDSERELWSRLRLKQVQGIQFYRQKPIGDYIVDFYAPKARLVVEVDSSQHMESDHIQRDVQRDSYLASVGLRVLRFNNRQTLQEPDAVVEVIFQAVAEYVGGNPPNPPLRKRD
jgi:very-short-patch-repair endonuclease